MPQSPISRKSPMKLGIPTLNTSGYSSHRTSAFRFNYNFFQIFNMDIWQVSNLLKIRLLFPMHVLDDTFYPSSILIVQHHPLQLWSRNHALSHFPCYWQGILENWKIHFIRLSTFIFWHQCCFDETTTTQLTLIQHTHFLQPILLQNCQFEFLIVLHIFLELQITRKML